MDKQVLLETLGYEDESDLVEADFHEVVISYKYGEFREYYERLEDELVEIGLYATRDFGVNNFVVDKYLEWIDEHLPDIEKHIDIVMFADFPSERMGSDGAPEEDSDTFKIHYAFKEASKAVLFKLTFG